MNFLQLVNDVIDESKQALDHLDVGNFDNPTRSVLYNRIKGWVAQSYADLLEERKQWFFTNERGVVTVQPRLHLAKINPPYSPNVGDVLVGNNSGVRFTITEVFFDNEGDDVADEATVSVEYDPDGEDKNSLVQWELLTAYVGLDEFADVARVENRGRYDLSQYIPTIDNVDMNTITIKRSVLDLDFNDENSVEMIPLRSLAWPQYMRNYDNFYTNLGTPRYVAQASNGDLQFYPYPDGLYDVAFDYDQKADELEDWDDIPTLLPEKHHKILVWMALKELADFNQDARLFSRGNKKYMERLGWLMRDYLPEVTLDTSRFYRW